MEWYSVRPGARHSRPGQDFCHCYARYTFAGGPSQGPKAHYNLIAVNSAQAILWLITLASDQSAYEAICRKAFVVRKGVFMTSAKEIAKIVCIKRLAFAACSTLLGHQVIANH